MDLDLLTGPFPQLLQTWDREHQGEAPTTLRTTLHNAVPVLRKAYWMQTAENQEKCSSDTLDQASKLDDVQE